MFRFAAPVALAGLLAGTVPAATAQSPTGSPSALPLLTAPLRSLLEASAAASATAPAPASTPRVTETGALTYYGRRFAGRRTASGERFDPEAMTMAHGSLPFGTRVRVTNLDNGLSVVVRVNDRTPSSSTRIGDVSEAAARQLDMIRAGVVQARLEVLRVQRVR